MKKWFATLCTGVFAMGLCSLAFAQDQNDQMNKDPGPRQMMGRPQMVCPDGMMEGRMMGMGVMMGMMGGKGMVPSSDGGVYVLIGNKLQKYDKDLTLKKEVQIKISPDDMQKMIHEMMEHCHMYRKMMQSGTTGPEEETPKAK